MTFTFSKASEINIGKSVTAGNTQAFCIHTVIKDDLLPNLDTNLLIGRKRNKYFGISGTACDLIWKARKAHGANESKESLRTYVSAIWKHGVAPYLKADSEGNIEYDAKKLSEANKKWGTGELSVHKARRTRKGTRVTLSASERFIKWYEGMSAENKAKFLQTEEADKIKAFFN